MTKYKAKSPWSGQWYCAPGKGTCESVAAAHAYPENDPHLLEMVKLANQFKAHMILREVPEEVWVHCPECDGTGVEWIRPFYDCDRCEGLGKVHA